MHPVRSLLVLALSASLAPGAETLVVGLPDPGRVPFFWKGKSGSFEGAYVQLINRLGTLAGFAVEYRMVPQARLIAEFNAGMIDLEPGIAPAWRPSAAEASISRYSTAFMAMEDVLIVPEGKALPAVGSTAELVRLNGLRVGQVRGFYVPEGLTVIEAVDEQTIARQVDAGNWDAGVMNAAVARWYKEKMGFTYLVSAPFASTPVSLRLHIQRARWVGPIDRALARLRRSGELYRLLSPGKR